MILGNLDIDESKFILNISKEHRTWEFYYKQYSHVVKIFIDIASMRQYRINRMSRPSLFLLRHSYELLLKMKISESGNGIVASHNLISLFESFGGSGDSFFDKTSSIRPTTEGDCFRYLYDIDGVSFFSENQIQTFDAWQYFVQLHNIYKPSICEKLCELDDDRIIRHELMFYPKECSSLGQIATQYDDAICSLLERINQGRLSINNCYLPLLFLIRHSLELKLKEAILSIGDAVSPANKEKLKKHSVGKLYNILLQHTGVAINKIPDDNPLKNESLCYQQKATSFVDTINLIDANSYSFRFPFNTDGSLSNFIPKNNTVQLAIQLYKESDTYLSMVVWVLASNGYLKLGDDILNELYN